MKRLFQAVANRMGYEFRRQGGSPENNPFAFARRIVTATSPIILDVGAHHGQTAKQLRSLFPTATIHCFEPFPESSRILEATVAGDSMTRVHRVGISNRNGIAVLNCNSSSATNSFLATDARAPATWGDGLLDTGDRLEVTTRTLGSFCADERIDRIDLLKLDTQGSEYAVLEGAAPILSKRAIGVLVFELITARTYQGQRRPSEYFSLLESHGYALAGVFNPLYPSGLLAQCDVAFTPTA